MLKSKPLKGGNVIADVRVAYMRFAQSLGVAQTLTFLYPRMVAVHVLEPHHGFAKEDGSGRIELPPLNRCTYSRVEPHGAYLLRESPFLRFPLELGSAVMELS
jgi:protein transport protein SEC24